MKPPYYWRLNKDWSNWIGQRGRVLASTLIRVSSPDCEALLPFSYVVVDFGNDKREMMGADHEVFEIGDEVICVLRKTAVTQDNELIEYGLKVTKVNK